MLSRYCYKKRKKKEYDIAFSWHGFVNLNQRKLLEPDRLKPETQTEVLSFEWTQGKQRRLAMTQISYTPLPLYLNSHLKYMILE